MSATAGTVMFVMMMLGFFFVGVILWVREGWMDRTADDVADLKREVGLMLGRERNRDEYLGIDVSDPVPDGPEDVAPADPVTEPIPVVDPYPATAPDLKVASSVGPLPSVDADWETRRAQIEAEWRAKAAEIGRAG